MEGGSILVQAAMLMRAQAKRLLQEVRAAWSKGYRNEEVKRYGNYKVEVRRALTRITLSRKSHGEYPARLFQIWRRLSCGCPTIQGPCVNTRRHPIHKCVAISVTIGHVEFS